MIRPQSVPADRSTSSRRLFGQGNPQTQARLSFPMRERFPNRLLAEGHVPAAAVYGLCSGFTFATSYEFFFLVTWLPTYLIREHGLTQQRAGFYAGVPLAVGAVACLTGGLLSDWLVARTGSLKWGRRLVGFGGYTLAALGYALAALADGPLTSVVCLALAAGAMDMAVPIAWATCVEIGGRFGGTTTGFMNTSSSLSAMISPVAAAWLFERFGSFNAMFASATAVYFLAGLLWFWIDPTRAVAD